MRAFATCCVVSVSRMGERRRHYWPLSLSANFGISFSGSTAARPIVSTAWRGRDHLNPIMLIRDVSVGRRFFDFDFLDNAFFIAAPKNDLPACKAYGHALPARGQSRRDRKVNRVR